jgi:hypothetical protein
MAFRGRAELDRRIVVGGRVEWMRISAPVIPDDVWTITPAEVWLGQWSRTQLDRWLLGLSGPLESIVEPFTVEMSR